MRTSICRIYVLEGMAFSGGFEAGRINVRNTGAWVRLEFSLSRCFTVSLCELPNGTT